MYAKASVERERTCSEVAIRNIMHALAKNAVRTDSSLALQGNLTDLARPYNTLFNKELIYQNPYQMLSVKSASTRPKKSGTAPFLF